LLISSLDVFWHHTILVANSAVVAAAATAFFRCTTRAIVFERFESIQHMLFPDRA
jgi:hypothetical protein